MWVVREGRARRGLVWLGFSLFPFFALGCGERSSASEASATASADAARPAVLFEGEPLSIRDLRVKLGRAGAPRDLDVRGRLTVVGGGEGRAELPVKIVCRHRAGHPTREARVVAMSRFIEVGRKSFALGKAREEDAFVEAGTNVGWSGRPDACEIAVRLESDAKAGRPAVEERLCWERDTEVLRRGGCAWDPLPPPSAAVGLHDVEAQQGPYDLEVHAHLRVGKLAPSGLVTASVKCSGGAAGTDFVPVRDPEGFRYEVGESIAIGLTSRWEKEGGRGACTLDLAWSEQPPMGSPDAAYATPGSVAPLGRFCVTEQDTREGACP
jgi:hypothetical protein